MVVDRGLTDRRVSVGEAAELVDVGLESVGVDGAERDAEGGGEGAEGGVVVDLVPRDVQRDGRGQPGEGVHLGGVRELLLDRAWGARCAEDLEAGSRVPERPRGQLDRLNGQLVSDGFESGHVGLFSSSGWCLGNLGVLRW